MEIRGIQPADHEMVDQLLEELDTTKKHIGKRAAKLRQELNYQPMLEIVAEEDGQLCGTASLHEITLNEIVCVAMGPIAEKQGRLEPLLAELKQRALSSCFRFVVWQPVGEIDPQDYGFEPAASHELYLLGQEKGQRKVYVLQLIEDSLAGLSGQIKFN